MENKGIGSGNQAAITVRINYVKGTAVAYVKRAFLASGTIAEVEAAVRTAEENIYNVEGYYPIVFYPLLD